MNNTPPRMFGDAPPPANENQKLLFMSAMALLLIGALVTMKSGAGDTEEKLASDAGQQEPAKDISIPALDINILNALVSDRTEESRVIQEEEGREFLLNYTAKLADAHYRALNATVLTADTNSQVLADPNAWRGRALRMRGYIQELREKARPNGGKYFTGTMTLDDGSSGHFVVTRLDNKDMREGSSVRIDGIVMKVFRGEIGDGWIEAPLVVGRLAARSFPALYTEENGEFTETELAHIVNDDMLNGIGSLPFEEKWKLLGRAAYSADKVNWSETEILDRELLAKLLENGDSYRGVPLRLPLDGVAVLNTSTDRVGENPARIDRVTDGWIAETSWLSTVPAVHFLGPFDIDYPVNDHTVAVGKGFFFKNLAYESTDAGLRRAPVFVLTNLDELRRGEENMVTYLTYLVFGVCVSIGALIFFLLKRDANSSAEFQKRLAARKRKRPSINAAN